MLSRTPCEIIHSIKISERACKRHKIKALQCVLRVQQLGPYNIKFGGGGGSARTPLFCELLADIPSM
jgi:hypothetical protein